LRLRSHYQAPLSDQHFDWIKIPRPRETFGSHGANGSIHRFNLDGGRMCQENPRETKSPMVQETWFQGTELDPQDFSQSKEKGMRTADNPQGYPSVSREVTYFVLFH